MKVRIDGHTGECSFAVTSLGKCNTILGENWLKLHNPEINWTTGQVQFTWWPRSCIQRVREDRCKWKAEKKKRVQAMMKEMPGNEEEEEERTLCVMVGTPEEESAIRSVAQDL